MNCPICQQAIKNTATFCPQCGQMIPRCPTCKMVLTKRMRFCKEDGTKIPESILAVFPLPVDSNTPEMITQGSVRTPINVGQRNLASASTAPTSTAESLKTNNGNDRGVQVQRFCVQCGKPCATTETLCHSCKKVVIPPKPRNTHKNQKAVFLILSVFLVVAVSAFLSHLLLSNGDMPENGTQSTELLYDSRPTETTLGTTMATTIKDIVTTEATETETTEPETTEPEVTTQETLPVQLEFSDWSTSLPDYVTEEHYIVEKQQLYSYSMLETTSSVGTNHMDGWELYASADGKGDFGPWSSWSTNKVNNSENRNVESEVRYRYSDKETKSSSSSSLGGWTLYDTTYAWGDYGSWSDWSTTAVSGSDSRKVRTKTQYSYRNISYSTEYSGWSEYSSWSTNYAQSSDTVYVESRYIEPTYRTEYNYSRYNEYNYATAGRRGWNGPTQGYWGGHYCQYYEERGWSTDRLAYAWSDSGYSVYGTSGNYWYNEQSRQVEVTPGYTEYRYRTRTATQVTNYGDWSSWSDSAYTSSDMREVKTQTLYQYCERSKIATYHYYRWTDWSGWSTTPVSSNSNRDVEAKTFYRYQDRVDQTTYYFRRWTAWSDYSTEHVELSDTVKVRTITEYRFKSK